MENENPPESTRPQLSPQQEQAIKDYKRLLKAFLFGLIIVLMTWIVKWRVIPFTAFEFWMIKGGPMDWLKPGAIFLTIACIQGWIAAAILERKEQITGEAPFEIAYPGAAILLGTVKCGLIATVEEIVFRWILFYGAIVSVQIINILTLGIFETLYLYLLGPLADFSTLFQLHTFLFHEKGWFVGAAILSANALFRDGHRYQGCIGIINSWFGGMYLFWCMFTFGLPAAIVFHFIYNAIIVLTPSLFAITHPRRLSP